MKKSKIGSYVLLHIILLIYSFGGYFSKTAASEQFLSLKWIFLYGMLIFTLGIYAVGWQQVLKKIPLNIAFVNKSVTIIWSMILGIVFFGEHLRLLNIVGGAMVISGVLLIVTDKRADEQTD